MRSEFLLAFNEICEARGLPKEEVFDALKQALVSAFRRDANLSSLQDVQAEIDPRTGTPTIFSEKEVVEDIIDTRTEVLLDVARIDAPEAELGDVVLVNSTTPNFGRIAAQTAKQVLLQRVREAEREQLYEDFSDREGELINGTVQSISGQNITIGLGRTEALLPRSQQVQGERYRAHDKIRVYVLEVKRTNRGPQIYVSRNHRNLLRRLLELEVPEIFNGQVDVKSIAREAGQRSKVAVQALQTGVDPVGACVGMRGVRIQSIVRELNDEKIDVIEWDSDQRVFISKALSPARVSHVFLEDNLYDGKTAVVIVPDDQLSLAIGREGQNARLAAKLTGWRIDIKSLTEAATESITHLDNPEADESVVGDETFVEQVRLVLEKKSAGRPITSEDYYALSRFVAGVDGRIIATRAAAHDEVRQKRTAVRKQIPADVWEATLDALNLPGRVHNLLLDNEIETVGAVLLQLSVDDKAFLNFSGFGDKALESLKERVAAYQESVEVPEEALTAEGVVGEGEETAVAETTETTPPAVQAEPESEEEIAEPAVEQPEPVAEIVDEEPEEEPEPEPEVVEEVEPIDVIDDLSKSLVDTTPAKPKKPKKTPVVKLARKPRFEVGGDDEVGTTKSKQLIRDEETGEVYTKHKRKKGRGRTEWSDFDER